MRVDSWTQTRVKNKDTGDIGVVYSNGFDSKGSYYKVCWGSSIFLISYPVNNRKGIVKRVRINESVLIDFVEELNEKSIVTLDFIKNRIKELVTLENLEYGVFMEYSSKEISHFSKNLRLFQRRGYTIDSGKLNYCSQCILSKDNCNECGIVKYNLLDNSKSLMI